MIDQIEDSIFIQSLRLKQAVKAGQRKHFTLGVICSTVWWLSFYATLELMR